MAKEANIPNLDGLLPHSRRDQPDIKPTLLRVMTDLYVQKLVHSPEEEKQYSRLALTLIDRVDAESRAAALQQLWNYAAAPIPVIQRLMRDTLTAIAAHEPDAVLPPAAYDAAAAQRAAMAQASAAPVVETKPVEAKAAEAKAAEPQSIEAKAIEPRVAAKPAASAPAAKAPVAKPPATKAPAVSAPAATLRSADELSELFFSANAEERRLILLNLPFASLPPAQPIAPAAAAEAVARLEIAALDHHAETFTRVLERTLSISGEQAHRLIEDESGEPLVVVAIALGMKAAVLQRILLCLNPAIAQSVQRVHDLANLYEDVDQDSAMRLVAIWQASHKPAEQAKPRHEQYLHVDSGRQVLPVSRPKIRWDEHAAHKVDVA